MSRPFLDLGDGLELRYLDPEDAEALQAVIERNRARLELRMSWAEGSTVETTRAFLASEERLDPLGIVVDGEIVGTIGTRPDRMTRSAEIGYWIDEAFEGRGIVTRGTSALIGYLFGDGLHRVMIRAAPDNERSRAVPERLGFTREGVLREAGWSSPGYHDLVVYGLLEHEWRAP